MDLARGGLLGKRHVIFEGTPLGFTEGPHLYKRDGWYHLLVAEGGTGRDHAVVMARSRSLLGPYEVHPDRVVLTSVNKPDAQLARAGHGDLVETPSGEPWMAYLCGRPLAASDRCVLGRETAIQPMRWGEDGWLRTEDGSGTPLVEVDGAGANSDLTAADERHAFGGASLPDVFQWLRTPYPEHLFSLTARAGHLRLYGREMIGGAFTQSLVARRQQAFRYTAETSVEADPTNFQQGAGLICYYNSTKFHFLQLTVDDHGGRQLQVMSAIPREGEGGLVVEPVAIPPGPVSLRVDVDLEVARFAYRPHGSSDWCWLPQSFDASILSDEATLPGLPNFTGAFVGMACFDLAGTRMPADFAYFHYRERD
jgi:xylan 1,4-beta-xylosidase